MPELPQLWWLLLAISAAALLVLWTRSRQHARSEAEPTETESSEAKDLAAKDLAAEGLTTEGSAAGSAQTRGGDAHDGPAGRGGPAPAAAGRELVRRTPGGPLTPRGARDDRDGGAEGGARRRPPAGAGPSSRPSDGPDGPPGAARSERADSARADSERADSEPGDRRADADDTSRAAPTARPAGRTGRTALFGYGGPTPQGRRLLGPYAVVAIRTNGFAPMRDRIIEIAVVQTDAQGRAQGRPFVTVLEPPGGQAGPTFLHGLEAVDLRFAPSFADLARAFLAQIEGRIVVTHQARFVEQFLAAEFLAAGLLVPTSPALDLSSLARLTFATPNYRLRTLAAHLELRAARGGAAVDEAQLVAAILPTLLARLGRDLTYPVPLTPVHDIPRGPARPAPRPRPVVPDTLEPWLDGLMTRLAAGATETNDPRVAAYLEALTDVVSRGRTASDESAELAAMLARSGYPAGQIRTILERFLESLRQAAFEESRISSAHLRHLRAVAVSVGIPTYFDDLIPPPAPVAPPPGSGTFSRPVRKPPPVKPPPRLPRCGHCLSVGHWTANCPRLRGSGGRGAVGPVRPVDPI